MNFWMILIFFFSGTNIELFQTFLFGYVSVIKLHYLISEVAAIYMRA